MVLDLVLRMDESVSIYGVVAIFDMAGVSWQHGVQMTPTIIKRYIDDTIDRNQNQNQLKKEKKIIEKSSIDLCSVGRIIRAKRPNWNLLTHPCTSISFWTHFGYLCRKK